MQKRLVVLMMFYFLAPLFLVGQTQKSHELVEEAWAAWHENKQQLVEQKFLAAAHEDPNNIRAHLGLSYLYTLQQKDVDAWYAFRKILDTDVNPYPYLFAAWITEKMRGNLEKDELGIKDLLISLTEKADEGGVLRAMANEILGEYYLDRGEYAKSEAAFAAMNTVNNWMVCGPFDNISASGFNRSFPPEHEFSPEKQYEGKNGVLVNWFELPELRRDYWVDFRRYFAFSDAVFYANTFVESPRKQTAQLRVGTSGSVKTFINDVNVISHFDENNNDLDTYIAEVTLQKGWNRILVKCGYSEITRCNFMLRITDEKGEPIENLNTSIEPRDYKENAKTGIKKIENFAEVFFQKQIEKHPDHLENYLLLADCYLRNDKAIEAELVLRDALKKAPNNTIVLNHLLEAYMRGEKYDEISTTIEKLYSIDKHIATVLNYKINQLFENEETEKAEELIHELEKVQPESEAVFNHLVKLYSQKGQINEMVATAVEALNKYPDNWSFVYLNAALAIQTTRSYDEAISLVENYLKTNNLDVALQALADFYLRASNVEMWEKTYEKIMKRVHAAPGEHYHISQVYTSMQQFEKAEAAIARAIAICPNSTQYWEQQGDIFRQQDKLVAAKSSYQKALDYLPTNYDARDKYRELDGKKNIFNHFGERDINDWISSAPAVEDYNGAAAVILLEDNRRVVYEKGASESSHEMLVRVFTKSGIDDFKEYQIPHHRFSEKLIVEKAVVIKPDRSEIKADVNGNYAVFKSLEEGDFIYLKWNVRNFYSGKLSNHFWDEFYFNRFHPIKHVRYALLVPEDFEFNHRTQNMEDNPRVTKTADGMLYTWSLSDVASIGYEYGMPSLRDIGKMLFVSSIPDWEYLVKWYTDLAKTKTRGSYEIQETVRTLFAGKEKSTDDEKIKTIYNYITENISYSSVPFRQSGLIPQTARDVLVTKIGDCKDVSTLAIAMLREVGVDANYVLVNTRDEGLNKVGLPSLSFNHCIAGVETDEGLKYLDLTAYNYPVGTVPEMDVNGFSLLIRDGEKDPRRLDADEFLSKKIHRESVATVNEDYSITVRTDVVRGGGSTTAGMRRAYREKTPAERMKSMTATLARDFPNVELREFEIDNLHNLSPEVKYHYIFDVPNYISEASQFLFMPIPWADKLEPDRGLAYDSRNYPYYYWPWADEFYQEIEIHIPEGYAPVELKDKIELKNDMAEYKLEFSFNGGVLKAKRTMMHKEGVIEPEAYQEFRAFYNDAIKQDNQQILLKKIE